MSKVEPGEIEVQEVNVFSFDKTKRFNIVGQVATMTIYEDVFEPTIYAEVFVYDLMDILNGFPIIGEESIEITLKTPGADKPIVYNFQITAITDVIRQTNGKGVTYNLHCVSKENLLNELNRVSKSYNTSITNMVGDIITTYLESKKGFKYEETKGVQQIVIPRMNPIVAIDFLRQRAASKKYASNAFVFFENARGFNFFTLEKLFEENVKLIGNKVFQHDPVVAVNNESGVPSSFTDQGFRNILALNNSGRTNSIGSISSGMLNSTTVSYDMITKKVTKTSFKLKDRFKDFKFIDKDFFSHHSQQFMDKYQKTEGNRYFLPTDSSVNDTFIPDSVGIKNAYFEMISKIKTSIQVYGDTTMAAGDVITCNFKAATGLANDDTKSDARMNGNYLVLQLAHQISKNANEKFTHRMSLGLIKGNFSS